MRISELYKLKAETERAASVQRDWEQQRRRLLALPAKLGFSSIRELKSALDLVSKKSRFDKEPKRRNRKRRTAITNSKIQEVKSLLSEKRTAREISSKTDLSPASVQNIKARLGLTRKRNKNR